MPYIRIFAVVSLLFITTGVSHAEPIGVEGARKLPIIDTHFHPMEWMKESEIGARMAEHNVILWRV